MPALGSSDRVAIGAGFQFDASWAREAFGAVVKADLQAAVAAVDDWVVANAASFNTALPLAARNGLTAAQKARLLMYVVKRRYETGA
jgi:hypothetical protein